MARGRGTSQRNYGGKSPRLQRVRVVCTSPAPASATSTEAPPATETVQALSPQKRQYNGSDLTLGGICKRCCRLITAYTKAREELEKLEAAAADDDGHARKLQEAQQMVAAKLAAVKDCEAQIKHGYFQEFNPDTAMASRRKSKKRKSDGLQNMGASDESATEGSGAASSAGVAAPSAAAARGAGRGGSGGALTFG